MATIDIKLKTYEQLQFEIMKLNIDIVLKDKQLDKYKDVIDKIKEIANKTDYDKWELQMTSIEKIMKIQKLLEEVE